MINQKLVEVLQCLDAESLEKLALFLRSPYFNNAYNAEQIVNLYSYLAAPSQIRRLDKLDKESLNTKYFPEYTYRPKQKNPIDALTTDLFKLVKKFIHVEMASKDNYESKHFLYLARFYLQNNLPERFQQTMSQFWKYQKKRKDVGPWYYLDSFLMELEGTLFKSIFNTYTDDINLISTHKSLDQFYKVSKLELTAALKYQKRLGAIDDEGILEKTQELFPTGEDDNSDGYPLNEYYQIIIKWLDVPPTLEELEAFSGSILEHRGKIENHAIRNLMAFYRNFYFQAYRKQENPKAYSKELFRIYKLHLEEGFFDTYDKILPVALHVVIAIALKCDEIEWAKKVLKKYPAKRIIGTHFAEEAHCLSEAEVFFANREYDLAMEKLVYRNFENVNYSIIVDALLIRIYYMTNNELIDNRIRALEQKIRRSKVAKKRRDSFLSFLKILNQVLKYEHDKTSDKWKKIQTKIDVTSNVIHREWLQQIINE
ncbi:MAG: hypothetical protein ACRBG0_16265 [Lewinella sp.]|uniref:hypothetical protein n=1 Tax=Lewinella sp. TaxID=2004506 RepID=UPI003D6BD076